MPKYRVLETSYVDNELVEPGEVIEYDGIASYNLELVDPSEAKAIDERNRGRLVSELKALGVEGVNKANSLDDLRRLVFEEKSRVLDELTAMPWVESNPRRGPDATGG